MKKAATLIGAIALAMGIAVPAYAGGPAYSGTVTATLSTSAPVLPNFNDEQITCVLGADTPYESNGQINSTFDVFVDPNAPCNEPMASISVHAKVINRQTLGTVGDTGIHSCSNCSSLYASATASPLDPTIFYEFVSSTRLVLPSTSYRWTNYTQPSGSNLQCSLGGNFQTLNCNSDFIFTL